MLPPVEHQFTKFTLLHEIAHWLEPTPGDDHGAVWRRTQVELVRQFLDGRYADALAAAYQSAGFAW